MQSWAPAYRLTLWMWHLPTGSVSCPEGWPRNYCFPAMWIGRTINNQQFWVHCFLPYQEQDDSFVSLTYFHSQHSKHRHRKSNSLGIKRWNKSLHRDYYSPHIYSGTESESSSDPTGRLSLCHLQWCRHQFWIVLLSITTGISKAKINQIYKSDHILQVKAPVKPNVLRNAFLLFFSLVVKKKKIDCLPDFQHKHHSNLLQHYKTRERNAKFNGTS